MALYFVRHGQTDWNAAKRFQSTTDVPLNAVGIGQAHCIRAELDRSGVSFALARSSPLSRARDTAEILLAGTGIAAQVEPDFIELSFGEYEGLYEHELGTRFGGDYDAWRASHYTLAPPGGESLELGAERVRAALEALLPAAISGDVLIVAHQAVMMAMKVALTGRAGVDDARSYKQENDEIDVWDADKRERIRKYRVECPAP